jgi:LmbE family N-acetylglucosaminyl deacetylase
MRVLGYLLRFRRRHVKKVATDVTEASTKRSALVLAPHPDDETLGCGAVILRKVAAGTPVTVVVVADGRHSHRSDHLPPAALGQMRRSEMVQAARRMGLAEANLRQLGYEDRTLTAHEDELVGVIAGLVKEFEPQEVYVTGAFEPHPDHAALGRAARRALAQVDGAPPLLMEYPIWMWSQMWHGIPTTWANRMAAVRAALEVLAIRRRAAVVDATPFVNAKMHALDAHVSQLRRPAGVPESDAWWGLPQPLMDAAADSVELFVPYRVPSG